MKTVLVTQRVSIDSKSGERRDALDQAWQRFLERCDLVALPVPNQLHAAEHLLGTVAHVGVLLTGGNDLACVGGDAPERDAVEASLVEHARASHLPVLGVCRGMQFLIAHFGGELERVDGHAGTAHSISLESASRSVNSYHMFGSRSLPAELVVTARAEDGVVEAMRHRNFAMCGTMWHPERENPAHADDIAMFRRWFGTSSSATGRK